MMQVGADRDRRWRRPSSFLLETALWVIEPPRQPEFATNARLLRQARQSSVCEGIGALLAPKPLRGMLTLGQGP